MALRKHEDAYLTPYRRAHQTHGPAFGVTLWASPASQRRRFDVFAEMTFLTGKRILDAGCSRGDFAAYLLDHRIAFDRYVGVDALTDVIVHARGRRLPRCSFVDGDFVTDAALFKIGDPQVVAISGTLNTMDDQQVFATLEGAWAGCGETLIFNFLSDRTAPAAPPQKYPARRLQTMPLLDWALSRTAGVRFRQDYFPHGHDATIVMRKPS